MSTPVPSGRGRWRLTLHARQFGPERWQQTILAQLDSARSRKLVQTWNQSAVLTFDMDGHAADAAQIRELQHDVIAWRWDEASGADVPVFRGIVDAASDQLDESSHVVTFTCHDYLAMLQRRLITSANQVTWTNLDQDAIGYNLVQLAIGGATTGAGQSFGSAAYLPLSVGAFAGDGTSRPQSGTLRTLTVQGNAIIGQLFDNLAKLSGGFDYDVQPFSATTSDMLRVFYPSQGVVRSEPPLIYGTNVARVQRQLTSADYSNYWRTIGNNQSATQSAAQVYGEALSSDGAAMNLVVGTFETADQSADQIDTVHLSAVAAGQLNIYGVLTPVYTLTLVPDFYSWGLLNMGDTMPVIVRSGRLNVNTTQRVLGITYSIGDDGQEDVDLVVGRSQTTLVDMLDSLSKDVRQLSRR